MAKGRPYNEVFEEYMSMGFDPTIIKLAWDNVKGDDTKLIDEIYKLQQSNNNVSQNSHKPPQGMEEDELLGKAIQESLDQAKAKNIFFEPLNPEQRQRKNGIPVGLKNVGNTCYFNSLLQAYFYNPKFIYEVLEFIEPSFAKNVKDEQKNRDPELKRKLASIELVKNLQHLFAGMIASDKKYLDPTTVITSIVDDYGNDIPIGDQKDIGQFNLYFLSRVEEGISLQDKYSGSRMEIEHKDNELESSGSKIGILGDHNSEDSLLKRSSIKVTSESTIGKQFFGKMQTSFLNEKEGISKTQEEVFTLLFVNVHHKQLYTAFEEAIYSVIEDYRNQKGEVVTVQKQTWIKEPPKTLFFQIQRVLYDKEIKNLKKIHDTFDFPKEFYIDPFLLSNRQKSLKIRKQVTKLRQRKIKLSQNLRQLENYNESNASVSRILTQTISILELQNAPSMEVEGNEFSNPILFDQVKQKVSKQNVNILLALRSASEAKVNYLKGEIAKLEVEIEKAYKTIRTAAPYQLQSILIHEGVADSGHYYSYSYDNQTNKWRKYNDLNVTDEEEEQVMKLARGAGVASAYYLVYTQVDQSSNPQGVILRNYATSSDPAYGYDVYSQHIPKDVYQKIGMENQQLYQDIETHKAAGYVSKVMDNYSKRFQTCNQLSRKLKANDSQRKKNSPPILVNLPLYIRSVGGNDEEYKASIIQSSIQEFGPKEALPLFEQILKNKFVNFNEFKRPKKTSCKQSYQSEFLQAVLASTLIIDMYRFIETKEWQKAAVVFVLIKQRFSKEGGNQGNQDYFTWLATVFGRVYLIQLLIQIQRYTQEGQFEKGISLIRVFAGFFSFVLSAIEEKSIIFNLVVWLAEIQITYPQNLKAQIGQISSAIQEKKKMPQYESLIEGQFKEFENKLNAIDINNQEFNFSRQEDTLMNDLAKVKDNVTPVMKIANDILREMKKSEVPLTAQYRTKFYK